MASRVGNDVGVINAFEWNTHLCRQWIPLFLRFSKMSRANATYGKCSELYFMFKMHSLTSANNLAIKRKENKKKQTKNLINQRYFKIVFAAKKIASERIICWSPLLIRRNTCEIAWWMNHTKLCFMPKKYPTNVDLWLKYAISCLCQKAQRKKQNCKVEIIPQSLNETNNKIREN